MFIYQCTLVLTVDYLEEIVGIFPWWESLHGIWAKHSKNLATILSNSSVGASKLICEYVQATSGTPESSMVSMPPPSQPCDPNDADDEGAVEVHLKLFKVSHHFLVYTFHQDPSATTLLLTLSQSLLQSPLQLLSELPPNHELYFLEAKPEVKPTCTTMSWALSSTAASSSASSSPLSTPCSTCSMKTKHDYISELQEQGCVEQAQTDHDAL